MQPQTQNNLILATDSYKVTHWMQYPEGMTAMFDYAESRGGKHDKVMFFGLQYLLLHYLSKRITFAEVAEAAEICKQHFGTNEFFPRKGWLRVIDRWGGRLPLRIRALPEGTVVPTRTPLFTVESMDPELPWLVSWVEGLLLKVWYPTTVATLDFFTKLEMFKRREKTMDDPWAGLELQLHDFGYRGASSDETAMLGGGAALVNFKGTDTLPALLFLRDYYMEPCAGFSIAASEHSTMTILGPEGEAQQMKRMIEKFGHQPIFACVSDSYDLFNAVENIWGDQLRDDVQKMNAVLVVRPDSGNPVEIVRWTVNKLAEKFGYTVNGKGYKVLNKVRVIQGDGIDHDGAIPAILDAIIEDGFSAENVAFGMGAGRLQKLNRDTYKLALKCSAAVVDGQERPVYKNPKTDLGKRSQSGCLDVIQGSNGEFLTVETPFGRPHPFSVMRTVYETGTVLVKEPLRLIRERADAFFREEAIVQGVLEAAV